MSNQCFGLLETMSCSANLFQASNIFKSALILLASKNNIFFSSIWSYLHIENNSLGLQKLIYSHFFKFCSLILEFVSWYVHTCDITHITNWWFHKQVKNLPYVFLCLWWKCGGRAVNMFHRLQICRSRWHPWALLTYCWGVASTPSSGE